MKKVRKTKVRQLGNSYGIIIPTDIVSEAKLALGSELDFHVREDGAIIVRNLDDETQTKDLIEKISSYIETCDDQEKKSIIIYEIVSELKELFFCDRRKYEEALQGVFSAYKENNADMLMEYMMCGTQFKDVLKRCLKRIEED